MDKFENGITIDEASKLDVVEGTFKYSSKLVKSKCMADMFVWLGFSYKEVNEGYLFERTCDFNYAWK